MDSKLLSYIPAIIGVFAIGLLVLLNDPKSTKNRLFATMSFLCGLWLTSLFLADTTTNLVAALWSLKLGLLFSGLMMVCFYVFSLHFPYKKVFNPQTQAIIVLPGLILALLSLTPLAVKAVTIRSFGVDPTDVGILYAPSDGIGLLYMVLGIVILLQKYTKANKQEKNQLAFVLYGLVIAIFGNVFSNIVAARFNLDTKFIWVGSFSLFIFSLLVAYSMVYYKLFDIRSFVVRAAAYLLTSVAVALVYVAPVLLLVGVVVMGYDFSPARFAMGVVVWTVAAINYERIKRWFDGFTSRIFFQDRYDSARLLGELNKILASSVDLSKIAHECSELISQNLKANFCFFVLNQTTHTPQRMLGYGQSKFNASDFAMFIRRHKATLGAVTDVTALPAENDALKSHLVRSNVAVIIKLSYSASNDNEVLGYMVLGFKKNGKPYDSQDLATLETIADAMVIAIQNSLHFEEIQKFNVTLQQRITEATAQLRRTNAKLKALDETKDDFISMASHQLRTPLTSVKGYLSMVLEGDAGKITPMQRKMLDQAFVSSQRMVFLIADLLNVSRLKTGKFVIEPSPVNLAKTVEDEIGQLKETAKNRELELVYDKPVEFPTLMIDETKIRQVIMNFIDNAIYYTPKGGRIEIQLKDMPENIELRIVDNGIGVPKREQPHLFTKFYRAGNARQARPDGTGLGLFMAKKVVVAQGGAVIFDSEEGKGSTFGFIFPKARLVASPAPQAALLHTR